LLALALLEHDKEEAKCPAIVLRQGHETEK